MRFYTALLVILLGNAVEVGLGCIEVNTGVYQGRYGFGEIGILFPKPQEALYL